MEYFIEEFGYIAYNSVSHPVFARMPRRVTFSDPVCHPKDYRRLLSAFLADDRHASLAVISEECAEVLRSLGFKINCVGFEPELSIQTYNTLGNWKELDQIKRARNEARREGLVIKEAQVGSIDTQQLAAVSSRWLQNKKVNDREIWIYARRPVFHVEEDVRKFFAFDKGGLVVGFVFYDPMYMNGEVFGYSANIVRCDERRFGKLATAIHMTAMETFKGEGKKVLNLCLAPFTKLHQGNYNDDVLVKLLFSLSERFGNDIYNFRGLSYHKSRYRGQEKPLYFASNRLLPTNDICLGFMKAGITDGYFSTVGQLLRGMFSVKAKPCSSNSNGKPE